MTSVMNTRKETIEFCCQLLCVYVILLKYHVAYLPQPNILYRTC